MGIRSFVLLLLLVAGTPAMAQPDHYLTTLRLQSPVVNSAGIDTVVFRWSTYEVFGSVSETELYNLTLKLYSGGDLRYVDHVVLDGEVQLFDGLVRQPLFGYFWDFNLTLFRLEQMVNASMELAVQSSGVQYVVNDSVSIPIDNVVDVTQYQDGVIQDGQSDFLDVQSTEPILFYDGFESGDFLFWSGVVSP